MWALVPVFIFWANCHGGFFMGWVMLGAYCGEALIRRLRKQPVEGERQLWLVSVASFLASGINPNGFRIIEIMLYYRGSSIQSSNLEWQYPAFWEPSGYSLVLFGALAALVISWRRTRPVDWILYFVFAAASLMGGAVVAFWVYFVVSLADVPHATRFSLRTSTPAMWFAPAIVLLSTPLAGAFAASLVDRKSTRL